MTRFAGVAGRCAEDDTMDRLWRRSKGGAGVLAWLGLLACTDPAPAQEAAAPPPAGTALPAATAQQEQPVADLLAAAGLTVGGLVEVEASAGREDGRDVSDVVLATLELAVAAEPAEWLRAGALLLWEEDETEPVDLDVATITLGGSGPVPFDLEAGKLYVPFGAFNSHFVSDPLVLELGETRETAAVLGYANGIVEIRLGAFNGSVDEEGDDDRVDDWVAAITLRPAGWVSCGAYWMTDLAEADGLDEGVREAVAGAGETVGVGADGNPSVVPAVAGIPHEAVGGAGGFVSLELASFAVEAEYVAALDDFKAGLLSDQALKPEAWNVELAWAPLEVLELAARGEGSRELPGMPESQYGACATFAMTGCATLALEYLHGEYEGETGNRDIVTAQVAVEF